VAAAADPGTLPRVLELFAKRGLLPDRCHAERAGPDEAGLVIDLELRDMDRDLADYIARCLREIHVVESVLTAVDGEGQEAARIAG